MSSRTSRPKHYFASRRLKSITSEAALYPRRTESSTGPPWKPQNSNQI